MKVIKRDGRAVDYDSEKIRVAISKANVEVTPEEQVSERQIVNIIKYIEGLNKKRILVEDIQDIIEKKLMDIKKFDLAKAYILYRYNRALVRKSNTTDESILSLIRTDNKDISDSNQNKNTTLAYMQREYIASEVSRDLTKRVLLPEKISKAYEDGELYFHASDYFVSPIFNASIIDLEDVFDNEVEIDDVKMNKPKDFKEACLLMTQVLMSALPNQYGGISVDVSALAKYIRSSKSKIKKELDNFCDKGTTNIQEIVNKKLDEEIKNGVSIINSQINSLKTTNGINSEITLFLYLNSKNKYVNEIELLLNKLLDSKTNQNKYNLIYVLTKNNNLTGGKYDYLTEMAITCVAKNKKIKFLSEKVMRENFNDNVFSPIGKNHFLLPYKAKTGEYQFLGRFNQGVVSINLPQIAIISKEEGKFFELLAERLSLCFEALMCKYYSLLGTSSSISPIHYNYGLISRLGKDERIDEVLKNDYSTLSLGYLGLSETVKLVKGYSISSKEGKQFALKIVKMLRNKVDNWRKETGIGFVLYALNSKKTGSYFAKIDKEKFGIIKDITDKEYYTDSYYLGNKEQIDIYEKLEIENEFLKISNGGGISVVEIDDIEDNISLVRKYIRFIHDNVLYVKFINKKEKVEDDE